MYCPLEKIRPEQFRQVPPLMVRNLQFRNDTDRLLQCAQTIPEFDILDRGVRVRTVKPTKAFKNFPADDSAARPFSSALSRFSLARSQNVSESPPRGYETLTMLFGFNRDPYNP